MNTALMTDLLSIAQKALEDIQDRIAKESPKPAALAVPKVGSKASMLAILEAFEGTDESTGKSRAEASAISSKAGINPGGLAGYFSNGLLKSNASKTSRWITDAGTERLAKLRQG